MGTRRVLPKNLTRLPNQTPKNRSATRPFRILMQDMVWIPLNLPLRSDNLQILTTWKVMRCRKKNRLKERKVVVCHSQELITLELSLW